MDGALLLERDRELAEGRRLLSALDRGHGAALVVEAPAGVGKTALVGALTAELKAAGVDVWRARAGEQEHSLAFGVVRQLLTPPVARAAAAERAALLAGPAGLAAPLLGFGDTDGGRPDPAAVLHGVHWLCVTLTERRPQALVVDDAHWADAASLDALAYLARHLEDLPLALVVATRPVPDGPAASALAALAAAGARLVRPRPLSGTASGHLVGQLVGAAPPPAVVTACHEVAGGNPFLLRELTEALLADGVDLSSATPDQVRAVAPPSVARSVLLRVARLPGPAVDVARAVALFPLGGPVRRVAALTGLTEEAVAAAADALAEAHVLAPGAPLTFRHPLLRTAVYEDLPALSRAQQHGRLADLLVAEGADAEDAAGHLLAAAPTGSATRVPVLLEATDRALTSGAHEAAVRYATRALEEPPAPTQYADVLHRLGQAELLAGTGNPVARLRAAVDAAADAQVRGAASFDLGRALAMRGEGAEAVAALDDAVAAVAGTDLDLALRYEAEALWVEWQDRHHGAYRTRLARLPAELPGASLGEQLVLCYQAAAALADVQPADRVAVLVRRALAGDRLARLGLDAGPAVSFAANAAAAVDLLAEAGTAVTALLDSSRRRGELIAVPMVLAQLGRLALHRGDLAQAAEHARDALDALGPEPEAHIGYDWARSVLIDALVEAGALEEARAHCTDEEDLADHSFGVLLRGARARLRVATGDLKGGVADALTVRSWCRGKDLHEPASDEQLWSEAAVTALVRLERLPEAREHADHALDVARRLGGRRLLADALRVAALTRPREDAVPLLREAAQSAADAPGRLAEAKALVALGAALRRLSQRADARDPLRRGLDLASRCGAAALAAHAEEELLASGARPRRTALTGAAALTPSERRVADAAAAGRSNREIAGDLFLTVKTVEMHLGNAFRKLEVRSRTELPAALAAG